MRYNITHYLRITLLLTLLYGLPVLSQGYQEAPLHDDVTCLAANMYFEARNQPSSGSIAVSHVVLNRVADGRYPDTICDVIKQNRSTFYSRCQFSWYCDGVSDWPSDEHDYELAVMYAHAILSGYKKVDIGNATLYHACSGNNAVKPDWDWSKVVLTAKIYDHCFYEEL